VNRWRAVLRRLFPYLVAAAGGFLTAYLLVFLVVFPTDLLPDEGKVPNVVGLTYPDAERRLFAAGYRAEVGDRIHHATSPATTVLAQTPPGGTVEQKGSTITLDVSVGPRVARVPNVVGQTQQQAQVAMENAGFDVGEVTEQEHESPRGTVISMSPDPGVDVRLPAVISLVVSAGPGWVDVPDVVGRTLGEARMLIESAGLLTGEAQVDSFALQPPGTVIGQDPGAGLRVVPGTRVSFRVAGRSP
jgi:eukaryotic-like serine/threonine-protein kinase